MDGPKLGEMRRHALFVAAAIVVACVAGRVLAASDRTVAVDPMKRTHWERRFSSC